MSHHTTPPTSLASAVSDASVSIQTPTLLSHGVPRIQEDSPPLPWNKGLRIEPTGRGPGFNPSNFEASVGFIDGPIVDGTMGESQMTLLIPTARVQIGTNHLTVVGVEKGEESDGRTAYYLSKKAEPDMISRVDDHPIHIWGPNQLESIFKDLYPLQRLRKPAEKRRLVT